MIHSLKNRYSVPSNNGADSDGVAELQFSATVKIPTYKDLQRYFIYLYTVDLQDQSGDVLNQTNFTPPSLRHLDEQNESLVSGEDLTDEEIVEA